MFIYLCNRDYIEDSEEKVRDFCIDYANKHGMHTYIINLLKADPIITTPKGKPFFSTISDIHFSISHTDNIWAMAVDSLPLGFDIELAARFNLRKEDSWLRIAKRFFTSEEYDYVKEGGRAAFLKIWVRKEAYMKYIGGGLAMGLDKVKMIEKGSLLNSLNGSWIEGIHLGSEIEAAYCSGCKRTVEEIIDYRDHK